MGVKNLKELKDKYMTRKSINSLRTKKIMVSSQASLNNNLVQGSVPSLVIETSRVELNGINESMRSKNKLK